MPHQCTNCGRAFPDGSKQMLSGCPDCGGNKFQFLPESAVDSPGASDSLDAPHDPDDDAPPARDGPSDPPASSPSPRSGPSDLPDSADASGPNAPGSSRPGEETADPEGAAEGPAPLEDTAQASARRAVVTDDELPAGGADAGAPIEEAAGDTEDRPDLSELRAELNDQFESIKILRPGEYELNLMELYDREEYVVALEEDGRYVIEVPSDWIDEADSGR